MKLSILSLIGCSSLAVAQLPFHPAPDITATGGNSWNLDWHGQPGIIYFIEYSNKLQDWNYMPIIESGENAPLGYGFESNEASLYLNYQHHQLKLIGSYETGFNENDETKTFSPIPNVFGIIAK